MNKFTVAFTIFVFFSFEVISEENLTTKEMGPGMSSTHTMEDFIRAIGEEPLGEIPIDDFNLPSDKPLAKRGNRASGKIFIGDLMPYLADDDVDEVISLIHAGIDVDADVIGTGASPLMFAESPEMVKALLENGADVNRADLGGATVLHRVISAERAEEMLPLLLEAGARVDVAARGMNDETPFLTARYLFIEGRNFQKAANITRMLYRAGASVDAQDADGYTALMTAAVNNKPRMANFMLLLGADTGLRSVDGKTALEYATELGHAEITDIIINTAY